MNADELDAIRGRVKAVRPALLHQWNPAIVFAIETKYVRSEGFNPAIELMVHAPADISALLSEVERLNTQIAALVDEVASLQGINRHLQAELATSQRQYRRLVKLPVDVNPGVEGE